MKKLVAVILLNFGYILAIRAKDITLEALHAQTFVSLGRGKRKRYV